MKSRIKFKKYWAVK